MNKFKSPISDQTYVEIIKFLNKNGSEHFFSADENIDVFKKSYPTFEYLISDLTASEQTRAWFYLQTLVKKDKTVKKYDKEARNNKRNNLKKNIILNFMIACLFITVGWLIFSFFTRPPTPPTKEQEMQNMTFQAKQAVRLRLKDPDSAEFRNAKGGCGLVNAKNSFGGFNGFTRYVVVANTATFETDKMPNNLSFDEFWDGMCKDQ